MAILACLHLVQRQLRVGLAGPVGLDLPACIAVLAECGVDRRAAALLLPFAEAGLMQAAAAKSRADTP